MDTDKPRHQTLFTPKDSPQGHNDELGEVRVMFFVFHYRSGYDRNSIGIG
jgi:hypothetical protein